MGKFKFGQRVRIKENSPGSDVRVNLNIVIWAGIFTLVSHLAMSAAILFLGYSEEYEKALLLFMFDILMVLFYVVLSRCTEIYQK